MPSTAAQPLTTPTTTPASASSPAAGWPRIVVADDHPFCLMALEQELRAAIDCEIVSCEHGHAAWAALRARPAAMLLTDLDLPGMDGLTLARSIRNLEQRDDTPRLPIVAVTATAAGEKAQACLTAGIDVVLQKPVTAAMLGGVLGELL
ncbi:response regulator [Cupriavidus agavae]|uniref:Response regulator receiver domain-containing protein n=1 Tax=Cupriavidus agavae TaxID=1001822 RepID=A0A4Q7RZZ2_9BURK|nr:response regulator [Cupriavidus agavae]RZT39425.1 response regulator receiver domain-containing protein [Cupriavidus agavae]